MTTNQMDYILELAQTQNFNRAAENCYISQPTMTYQINNVEKEIGFRIFDRSGKGATLTPAGAQFVISLRTIREELKNAIEQGQNFSAKFKEAIRIVVPIRSAVYFLPDAIMRIMADDSALTVTPAFDWYHGLDTFLGGEADILFAVEDEMKRVPDVTAHHLFDSKIYLICRTDDVLAEKTLITAEDLRGRTLMVGGGSQAPLRAVQQRVINTIHCDYFNSHDHDTSLTNVAAKRAIVLAPGFLNDHSGQFAWVPFDCDETISCALYTHVNDHRWSVMQFIRIIQGYYDDNPDFPV